MSAAARYTLGPWTHEGQGDITGIENDPENCCVGPVDVACVYLRTVPGRTEANARLIAAAPELLDALKELRDWYQEHIGLPACAANAAISKATGAQP